MRYSSNIKSLSLIGLNGKNQEEYFTKQFIRWRFHLSDEVLLDGRILSKDERTMRAISFYDFGDAKTLTMSDEINGSELTESRFIEHEIKRVKNLKKLSIQDEYNKQDYLSFLTAKQINSSNSKDEISYAQIALKCIYEGKQTTMYNCEAIEILSSGTSGKTSSKQLLKLHNKLKDKHFMNYSLPENRKALRSVLNDLKKVEGRKNIKPEYLKVLSSDIEKLESRLIKGH